MPVSSTPATDSTWLRPGLVASWKEIVLVLAVTTGPFAWRSGWAALHGSGGVYLTTLMSDRLLLGNTAVEGSLLALFLFFLHLRHWTTSDFKIKPGGWSTLQGIALGILMGLANVVTVMSVFSVVYHLQKQYATFASFLMANSPHLTPHGIHLSWTVLIGALILNAFFEELTCIGYAFNQVAAKLGPFSALLLVTLLRMSCHTYQGPVHMLGIGSVFFLTGYWYWRTRNLWPLIFAHAMVDLISMAAIKVLFS